MLIQPINNKNNQNFGNNYRLSKRTIESIEKSTGLTYEEMTRLTSSETRKLMIERGIIKEPGKFKLWMADKYRRFGEKFGLLKKQYNIYTDAD